MRLETVPPDLGDGELRADVGHRFLCTLNRMLPPKVVVKDGYGADARWRLPNNVESDHRICRLPNE